VVLLDVEKPRVLPSTRQSAEESKRHHSGERLEFHQRSWWDSGSPPSFPGRLSVNATTNCVGGIAPDYLRVIDLFQQPAGPMTPISRTEAHAPGTARQALTRCT
jgi:hypothetical protein